jgi:hypothetical protein
LCLIGVFLTSSVLIYGTFESVYFKLIIDSEF